MKRGEEEEERKRCRWFGDVLNALSFRSHLLFDTPEVVLLYIYLQHRPHLRSAVLSGHD